MHYLMTCPVWLTRLFLGPGPVHRVPRRYVRQNGRLQDQAPDNLCRNRGSVRQLRHHFICPVIYIYRPPPCDVLYLAPIATTPSNHPITTTPTNHPPTRRVTSSTWCPRLCDAACNSPTQCPIHHFWSLDSGLIIFSQRGLGSLAPSPTRLSTDITPTHAPTHWLGLIRALLLAFGLIRGGSGSRSSSPSCSSFSTRLQQSSTSPYGLKQERTPCQLSLTHTLMRGGVVVPPTTYSLTLTRPRPRTHTHPRRVCIEGTYLLAGACVTACPAGMMSMGFGQFKRRYSTTRLPERQDHGFRRQPERGVPSVHGGVPSMHGLRVFSERQDHGA